MLHTFFTDETLVRCVRSSEADAAEKAGARSGVGRGVVGASATIGDHLPDDIRLKEDRWAASRRTSAGVRRPDGRDERPDPAVLARFRRSLRRRLPWRRSTTTATTDELEHVATLIPDEWLAPSATGSPQQCARRRCKARSTWVPMASSLHGASPAEPRTGPRRNRLAERCYNGGAMTTDHERRDLADIEALSIEFWYRVDHQNGVGVADLFTEDGVYSVANGQSAGRAAIAESLLCSAAAGRGCRDTCRRTSR